MFCEKCPLLNVINTTGVDNNIRDMSDSTNLSFKERMALFNKPKPQESTTPKSSKPVTPAKRWEPPKKDVSIYMSKIIKCS